MSGMLNALVILCGMDYSGANYKNCVKKTGSCHAKLAKEITFTPDRPLTEKQKQVFYKCYSEGYIAGENQVAIND